MRDGSSAENLEKSPDPIFIPSPTVYAATRLYRPPVEESSASKTRDEQYDKLTPNGDFLLPEFDLRVLQN